MNKFIFLIIFFLISCVVNAQTVKVLTVGTQTSLRGLSVVNDKVFWASGSNGTVVKSIDGGKTFKWLTIKGFEKTDFRDIEAFDENTAIIMGIAEPAYILKTTDGGETWKTVYKNETKGMFLDALDFSDRKNGILIGDPINDAFFIVTTKDVGETWQEEIKKNGHVAKIGEACFASSGTNIKLLKKNKYFFVTGGMFSNLHSKEKILSLPVLQGKESTGANSIDIKNKKTMIVVGGDFNQKDSSDKNCFISNDGGKNWVSPDKGPDGYRSCIRHIKNDNWITCGLSGVDVTNNNGKTFTHVSNENLHVCAIAKKGKRVFLAGNKGKIAVFIPR